MTYPDGLEFLEEYTLSPNVLYKQADWLLSDFDDVIWEYSFGFRSGSKFIDWRIDLSDGSKLTDPKNRTLLNSFKYWLIVGTKSTCVYNSVGMSMRTQAEPFRRTLLVIDYLLLKQKEYDLISLGLEGLTYDQFYEFLEQVASCADPLESLFDWSVRLSDFLLCEINKIGNDRIAEVLRENPQVAIVTRKQKRENTLSFGTELIPQARAVLFEQGYYRYTGGGKYGPNTKKLMSKLYPNSLFLKNISATYGALYYEKGNLFSREYDSVTKINRRGRNKKMFVTNYAWFHKIILNIQILNLLGIPVPEPEDFVKIKDFTTTVTQRKHHITVPSQVVFTSIKSAIDLHLRAGEQILDSFCAVAALAKKKRCS